MAIHVDKNELHPPAQPAALEASRASDNRRLPKPQASLDGTSAAKAATDYAKLAAKLSAAGRDPASLNALGVCHLRLGNIAEAVRIYRGLALQPGCIWERPETPALYKRNFATALLLAGLPGGCISVLHALAETDNRRTEELLAAIKSWEQTLPFFQRWDWRLNWVTPKNCRIPLDFEPGEFE